MTYRIWGKIPGDHAARPDNRPLPDSDAGKNHAVGPDPDIVLNDDRISLMSLLTDGHITPGKHMVGGTEHRVRPDQHILTDLNASPVGTKDDVLVKRTTGSNVQFSGLIRIEGAASHETRALLDGDKFRVLNYDLIA